ncbi:hypothetical protein [uncultured Hoeflea sp.]|uniref:hypothetical protein n=1 Tax=uncultured Hoeflea sp. TaxID=538666 RepID=UPI00261F268A|nr:hypothetical protein [uncultured Hoeflea sp.]
MSFNALIQIDKSSTRRITDIRVGDTILAFDPNANRGRGALIPRRVTRLYRNTTTEWIRLTWIENGEAQELVTTPGHHFLDQFGEFPPIEAMIAQGRATVVLASGELTEVTAERIVYSSETADMFEQAQAVGVTAGNAAIKLVAIDAWQAPTNEITF